MSVQTIDLPGQARANLKAASAVSTRALSRLTYLDTLRAVMCVLVILVHTAVTYGSLGDWTFIDHLAKDEMTSILLTFFVILSQSFFMGLFFFISGYFIPGSIDRKGMAHFWKDRLLRLGLPFLAYTFLLSKLPIYLAHLRGGNMHRSFPEFILQRFWQSADAGPTWFLFALLVFSAGYTLWRLASSRTAKPGAGQAALPVPGKWALLGFAGAIAAGMFAVSQVSPLPQAYRLFGSITLMLSFFPQYILMFAAGILAYRGNWLANLPAKSLKFWAVLSACTAAVLPLIFVLGGAMTGKMDAFWTGLHWQSAAVNLWIALACVSFSMTLILWLRGRSQSQSPLMGAASASTFATYLIHPLVLVPITYALSFWAFHPLAKFALAGALAIAGSFAVGIALRRIPGVKAVL
ncbi:MAG TPA: acyltransferase family protein [Anaerolineaceae bacterium]